MKDERRQLSFCNKKKETKLTHTASYINGYDNKLYNMEHLTKHLFYSVCILGQKIIERSKKGPQ